MAREQTPKNEISLGVEEFFYSLRLNLKEEKRYASMFSNYKNL